jgi:VWFA-related protein
MMQIVSRLSASSIRNTKFSFLVALGIVLVFGLSSVRVVSGGQSGGTLTASRRTVTLNVIVRAPGGRPVTKDEIDLYDSGMIQEIENFGLVDAGSRIILMIDSSSSLKAEATALQKAALELINELYSDDQMMVVGYNETAEIIEEMTLDLSKLQASSNKIIRKGFPNLFDALIAVSDSLASQAKTGIEKRAVILISDGYDSESKTKFDDALIALQDENIVLYAIQVPDRTRGALLRDKPKPPIALARLTEGTGGQIFSIAKISEAAKEISSDLRNRWYRLIYTPSGVNTINSRRLLLMARSQGLELRTKGSHPGRYRSH